MMIKKNSILLLILLIFSLKITAQEKTDKEWIKSFYDISLTESKSYEDLRYLCKKIGHRLSGSKNLEKAIVWGDTTMQSLLADSVYLQEVKVANWKRGKANGYLYSKDGRKKMHLTALGGSVGTGLYKISGSTLYFPTMDSLKNTDASKIKDKIVFIDKPIDDKYYDTFSAYGSCVSIRFNGAVMAAKKGAKAVLIRSLTNSRDNFAHTGVMGYKQGVDSIPAFALSWKSAEYLKDQLQKDSTVTTYLKSGSEIKGFTKSHNVVAELKGFETPENIITIGAHIDSWDLGEGAHDDGAGTVQVMGVLRLLTSLEYQNKNTIRFVLFTNEENGAAGAYKYAEIAKSKNENHILAIESDRGGFSPRGFSIDTKNEAAFSEISKYKDLLLGYGLHDFSKGYAGVDISPLKSVNENIILLGLKPDSQRYFDYHHAKSDVFEAVNRRELELGTASIASMLFLLDQNYKK